MKEAEAKLSDAIKAGNMDHISIAHGLLEVARRRMQDTTHGLSKAKSEEFVLTRRGDIQSSDFIGPDKNLSSSVRMSKTDHNNKKTDKIIAVSG